MERSYNEKVDALRRDNKTKEDQWSNEMESLRSTKDMKIRQLDREKEEQRNAYELRINELDSKIRSKKNFKLFLLLNSNNLTKPPFLTFYRTISEDSRAQLYHHLPLRSDQPKEGC